LLAIFLVASADNHISNLNLIVRLIFLAEFAVEFVELLGLLQGLFECLKRMGSVEKSLNGILVDSDFFFEVVLVIHGKE
jgi:hypothetical protein